ncbi:DUF1624 domain-containing protein [Limoniibacter endophyticus]|nr:DUF1624 domain-containing protein [Limoniibacter endophyticus]
MNADQPFKPLRMPRIASIDVARGLALVAMAIYHFTWDLSFFGYVAPDLAITGGWRIFARLIATSFLFLVGVSLILAHGNGIRWQGFWKRFWMVAVAALLITVATYFLTPPTYIFFGILHHIALASLLGLLFLRLPPVIVAVAAVIVAVLPFYASSDFFDPRYLAWTGLAERAPRSNDLVPLFPFFAAVLAGIAATKLALEFGLAERLSLVGVAKALKPLETAGRHSLLFYLVHQPVLIGFVWVFSQVVPPPPVRFSETEFSSMCMRTCTQERDGAFCTAYCGCMLDRFKADVSLFEQLQRQDDLAAQENIVRVANQCSLQTEQLKLPSN